MARAQADGVYADLRKTRAQFSDEERQRIREDVMREIALERTARYQTETDQWIATVGDRL